MDQRPTGPATFIDPKWYRAPLPVSGSETERHLDFFPSTRCSMAHVFGSGTQVVITSYEFWALGGAVSPESPLQIKISDLKPNARLTLDFDSALALREQLDMVIDEMKVILQELALRALNNEGSMKLESSFEQKGGN